MSGAFVYAPACAEALGGARVKRAAGDVRWFMQSGDFLVAVIDVKTNAVKPQYQKLGTCVPQTV